MSRRTRRCTGIALPLLVLLAIPTPAYADNCGDLQDCYGTIAAALAVLVAFIVIALLIFLLWEVFAVGAAMGEAAAVGLAEGAAEGVAEIEAEASFAEWLAAEEAAAAEAAEVAAAAEAEAAAAAEAEAAAAEAEAEAAVESAQADPNKVGHIFENPTHPHNWEATGLDQAGNWNLIEETLGQNYELLPESGIYEVTQVFEGYSVTVRGRIVDGIIRIGSAWVNPL